jgi:hypothetical protein
VGKAKATTIQSFPTVLVVGNEAGFSELVETLRFDGYLVLQAASFDAAVQIVKIHSREIHVMVAYGGANAYDWTAILNPFRLAEMAVVRVIGQPDAARALAEVHTLLQPPNPPAKAKRKEVA